MEADILHYLIICPLVFLGGVRGCHCRRRRTDFAASVLFGRDSGAFGPGNQQTLKPHGNGDGDGTPLAGGVY